MTTRDLMSFAMEVLDETGKFLSGKNRAYGDSVGSPVGIFSKLDRLEAVNARIDDKLSRIARGDGSGNEDAEQDLLGYLVLRRAIIRMEEAEG